MPMSMNLDGEVTLVTGASRGLGRAGASVAVTDFLIEDAEYDVRTLNQYSPLAGHFSPTGEVKTLEKTRDIQAMGTKSCAIKLDVTDYEDVKRVVQAVEAQLGPIDILVNNAAVMDNMGKFDEQKPERWNGNIQVNLTGAYHCISAV